ncbi:MAG TPA: 16S rRNA (cytosine(1402)-N(4))-methyltransferase RsmH [Actinomycetota bacterium]|nr:16S rRNA (cytosine(1402)-N(4))-methyltransferase RsmH [Actinomycetota bacterium]
MASPHRPVLVTEVVELMANSDVVVDATTGAGGHAEALLESGVGLVIGIDRDPSALKEASERLLRFGSRFRPVQSVFSKIAEVVRDAGRTHVGGALFDLGVSSMQLDRQSRGFSYRGEGPLDMRMGDEPGRPTAADVVNSYPEDRLARLITEYGEERFGRRIAAAISRARDREPITTTAQLAAIVAGAVPRTRRGPHPARRTFQALRLEVNRELEELAASLPQAVGLLEPGGRLVVISYHSLEDRIAKRFFSDRTDLSVLTRKPIRPSPAEVADNPRARSAKLRAGERKEAAA